jgi:hypothetical protein
MKIPKMSAIVLAVSAFAPSALPAGPVLAQGAPSSMKTRGTVQSRAIQPVGADVNAQAPGKGAAARSSGTVGSATGGMTRGTAGASAPTGSLDAAGDAAGAKR